MPSSTHKGKQKDRFESLLRTILSQLESGLKQFPDNLYFLWLASFYGALAESPSETVRVAGERFDSWRATLAEDEYRDRMERSTEAIYHIEWLWEDLTKTGDGQRAWIAIVNEIIGLCDERLRLNQLGDSARRIGRADFASLFYDAAKSGLSREQRVERQEKRRAEKEAREAAERGGKVGSVTGKVTVTLPGGKKRIDPDDGRDYPPGTMLSWDVEIDGRREMRWTTVGGCPFGAD